MVTSSPQHTRFFHIEYVLNHLTGVRPSMHGWVACCPAHADREPSLSIGIGEDGQVLLKCFAGCSLDAIVQAIGMTVADLFPGSPAALSPDGQSESIRHRTLAAVTARSGAGQTTALAVLVQSRCHGQ